MGFMISFRPRIFFLFVGFGAAPFSRRIQLSRQRVESFYFSVQEADKHIEGDLEDIKINLYIAQMCMHE